MHASKPSVNLHPNKPPCQPPRSPCQPSLLFEGLRLGGAHRLVHAPRHPAGIRRRGLILQNAGASRGGKGRSQLGLGGGGALESSWLPVPWSRRHGAGTVGRTAWCASPCQLRPPGRFRFALLGSECCDCLAHTRRSLRVCSRSTWPCRVESWSGLAAARRGHLRVARSVRVCLRRRQNRKEVGRRCWEGPPAARTSPLACWDGQQPGWEG